MNLEAFHFLRPECLLLLLPAAGLIALLWHGRLSNSSWHKVIDASLLTHLLDDQTQRNDRWPILALAVAALIGILALAGPAWQRLPQPVSQSDDALLIALDLSLSMRANDVKPSRIERVQLKLRDVLAERAEGLTALIAYAGDAHTVAPFTDDARTIESMLPALQPEIMPKLGSRPDIALRLGQQLLQDANLSKARVLLVTDDIRAAQIQALKDSIIPAMALSILSVGTREGGPIPLPQGGFLKDNAGEIVVAKLDAGVIREAASQLGAAYATLSNDRSDIDRLLPAGASLFDERRESDREFDVWQDEGAILVLLLLPLCLLAFRRGLLLPLMLVALLPPPAKALDLQQTWSNLWQTRDQQANKALESGDAARAQELFQRPDWKASAAYRAGDFSSAAEMFADQSHYNTGNSLAKAGQLDAAIEAYKQALAENPDHEDAAFNKKLIEDLQQQQQNQQQSEDQEQNQENDQQDQPQDQQNQNQSGQDQQDSDQQQAQDSSQAQPSAEPSESEQAQQSPDEQNPEQQQAEQRQDGEQKPGEDSEQQMQTAGAEASKSDLERQQELDQWLRKVPDDPGGLLRNKFRYQYEQNRRKREHYDKDGQLY